MTVEEFSNEFDILLNSHNSINPKIGLVGSPINIVLDEYEKSIYLTKAQEEVIKEIYNGQNPEGISFESTEEIRRYLSSLVKTVSIEDQEEGYTGISSSSVFYELPSDLWFITYESAYIEDSSECLNGKNIIVIPTTQDDYYRTNKNPFKQANTRRALRLDVSTNIVEIISDYKLSSYLLRYMTTPSPIILLDLGSEGSINNTSSKTECKLNSAIHRIILDRAVQLALSSKIQNTNN